MTERLKDFVSLQKKKPTKPVVADLAVKRKRELNKITQETISKRLKI